VPDIHEKLSDAIVNGLSLPPITCTSNLLTIFANIVDIRHTSADGQTAGPLPGLQTSPLCVANQPISFKTAVGDVVWEEEQCRVEMMRVGHVTRMRTPLRCNHTITMVTTDFV